MIKPYKDLMLQLIILLIIGDRLFFTCVVMELLLLNILINKEKPLKKQLDVTLNLVEDCFSAFRHFSLIIFNSAKLPALSVSAVIQKNLPPQARRGKDEA